MENEHRERSRRRFLRELAGAAGAVAVAGSGTYAAAARASEVASGTAPVGVSEWFPRQDPRLVQQVVGLAHRDLEGVRRLVSTRPELAKAQWDWGFGDWESALDAASHTGRREIALLLLDHGARPTIFSAAMLGQLAVVRAFVAAAPGAQAIPGPHGIPLLSHAKAGGEPAAAVVAYLEELGGADGGGPPGSLADAEVPRYLGSYRHGDAPGDLLEVARGAAGITLARVGGSAQRLFPLGEHAFRPAGAPSVRVRFEVAGERARTVAVFDPDLLVRATRVG